MEFLAPILGFLSPFIKVFFEYKQRQMDNAHELAMMQAMNQRDQILHEQKMKEIDLQADIAESRGMMKIEAQPVPEGFIAGLRASVRPVVTYYFVLFYSVVKAATYYILIENPGGLPWREFGVGEAIQSLWTTEEQVFLATILAFWFGNRAMEKSRNWVARMAGVPDA